MDASLVNPICDGGSIRMFALAGIAAINMYSCGVSLCMQYAVRFLCGLFAFNSDGRKNTRSGSLGVV